ncbi:hypothetical protein QTP70_004449 [Hemibagrus guttatus]|uniref:Calx-beta domain-containing protein n=1 Tax=Hemibagrus guttatus TaxID=175788 RepID=A0AAE0QI92_9TELE|nr:hypothetical protein QTP70_004449 [Hemibagrus guttatus]
MEEESAARRSFHQTFGIDAQKCVNVECEPALIREENGVPMVDLPILLFSGTGPTSGCQTLCFRQFAPVFYFGDTEYHVDESQGDIDVRVWRTGTDLSKAATVTVRSRKTDPVSAEAGVDYVGISKNLDFAPGVNMQTVRVTIMDDLGQPLLEGTEKFELVLRMASNGILGEPSKATVLINDSISDLPKMQFKHPLLTGEESNRRIIAVVQRSGDITHQSTVRCYTRQGSAQVASDFEERPNTDVSIITFLPGDTEKPCVLTLVDDSLYEEEEEMRLVLGSATSDSPYGASIGAKNETLIKIKDSADKPVIKFAETKLSVNEPKVSGKMSVVRIPVLRVGDSSKVSVVRVHTKDGSAVSGEDYHPISQDVEFKEGETEHFVEVEILFDGAREMREAFTVHLKPDENMVAEIQQITKAIVYIEESNSMADVTFPSLPHVMSLLHYDDVRRTIPNAHPPAGYPVVCVTVGCELEEKERFWSELDEVMESIPTGERVVIGADFNGHVGEGNTGDEEVMGKFGVKERNLEGQMVVDFAKRMDMGVVNTYFQKREEHRVTYKSGGRRTQVDYILCRRGNLKEISDCKVVVGESVARQHTMVVCRMTLMFCKTKRSKIEIEKKTKWWQPKKEECCEEFRQKLRQALGGQVLLPDDWETTAEVIRETGRKVLGVSSGRRKEDKETWWWNEEVQDSIQRKRLAKKKGDMDRTEENRQEYKELQRRVKREVSKAKQKAYDELYTRLDTREGEKDLYRVLTSEENVQRRWKEYFRG